MADETWELGVWTAQMGRHLEMLGGMSDCIVYYDANMLHVSAWWDIPQWYL